MTIEAGVLLADRYRLTSRIAAGGMGEVWTASDERLARDVAVKILKPELTADPEFVDRFRSEARITASLNDPGIAAVHDYGEVASRADGPRDTAYLVMELVAGDALSVVLERAGRLSPEFTLDVVGQAARALQAAHIRGLVHRDIKPGNILITASGQVKVTDFGIAKAVFGLPITRAGLVMGTAQYFAPEQAAGAPTTPASDVYALGVVTYECLAGVRPFDDTSPVAVVSAQVHRPPPPLPADVPPAVAALVAVTLAKDPAQRYPDGAALAAACAAVRAGGAAPMPVVPGPATPVPVSPAAPVPPGAAPGAAPGVNTPALGYPARPAPVVDRRRRGTVVILIAAAIVAVAAVILVIYLLTRPSG